MHGRALTIALFTDAWLPQVNGVVRTLTNVQREVTASGHTMVVVHPGLFRTLPCPRYSEIRLALACGPGVRRAFREHAFDAVHIATEGPIGLAARRYCGRKRIPFTTSYHTQFAQYIRRYAGVPTAITFRVLRWFHGGATRTLVPSESIRAELAERGFEHLRVWTRGVDFEKFRAYPKNVYDVERPIFLYAGRVAREKNLEAFLAAELPGSKVVVGDGPARESLERRFPEAHFVGYKQGEDLARHYASADVFVFPSRTDTFGIVLIEALACGLPIAAYPVTGPRDIVESGVNGVLDEDLGLAARKALAINPASCRASAMKYTWSRCAEIFLESLAPIR